MSDNKFIIVHPSKTVETKTPHQLSLNASGPKLGATKSLSMTVRRSTGQRRTGKKKGRKGAPSLPQNLNLVSVVPHIGRFSCTSTATQNQVTRGSLAGTFGAVVTTANTSAILWASSYRITKIVIWPAAGSSPILEFPQGGTAEQALQKEVMNNETMPTGITLDRPLVWRPPRKSYLSQWQVSASNPTDQLFLLSAATGSVVDVHSVFTLASGVGIGLAFGVSTSSTVPLGTIAYFPIDVGNKFQPVGLSTILH